MYSLYVLYNGTWTDILDKGNNLAWSSDIDTLGTELQFDSIYDIPSGTQIALKNYQDLIIGGVLVKQTKKRFVNSYSCYDYAFYLNKSKTTIQFNNISGTVAIQQLLNQFSISGDICNITTNIKKIYKAQEISSIIDDILTQATAETGQQYIKEMIGYKLTISKLSDMKITPQIIIGADISMDSSIEDMVNKVIIQSTDDTDTTILATAQDTNSIKNYGLLQDIQTSDNKNQSQLQQLANTYLATNNKIFKELDINVVAVTGADTIKANRLINVVLPNFGVSGWIKIKSANHAVTSTKHTVSLVFDI